MTDPADLSLPEGAAMLRSGTLTSRALTQAVLDRIEMAGRLSWLHITDSQYKVAAALPTLAFVTKTVLSTPLTFTLTGQVPITAPAYPAAGSQC